MSDTKISFVTENYLWFWETELSACVYCPQWHMALKPGQEQNTLSKNLGQHSMQWKEAR